ncbi:MAG: NAD(P)(+) transhydrogenase (Re/Si-specific) subunit beta [Oscillospiraceae bacterium]|nr:NAD(P)(+) transhydrogenase (Re/Si-specific) subunit beta [Oscillospiraceae bacterium]
MSNAFYYLLCGICTVAVLLGVNMMSKVKSAVAGNALSATAMAIAIGLLYCTRVVAAGSAAIIALILALAVGTAVGIYGALTTKMIAMPQIIALLNGLGGAASSLVAAVTAVNGNVPLFEGFTAGLALAIGALTFTGSLIAAGKLARILDARPKSLPNHSMIMAALAVLCVAGILLQIFHSGVWAIPVTALSLVIGVVFVMRVGGADMPITISLLNALSGVAGGIAGMAINEPLLVAIGGIVGASGLILTQDMCKAMNRKLVTILTGKTTAAAPAVKNTPAAEIPEEPEMPEEPEKLGGASVAGTLRNAEKVIIVPGYGMALSQAQADVAEFAAALERRGAEVKFAIHPVAGRMPGHMSVLLCEADIDYDKLYMMEDINDDFASCDIAVVIGANDVTNPTANTAEGTPIYGMPVLDVEKAPMAVFCNFDINPGYAGVPNPLYEAENVLLMLGDAKESVQKLLSYVEGTAEVPVQPQESTADTKLTVEGVGAILQTAQKVIIVPGYGMALSQAQADVAEFAAALERRGAEVKFAIHPVAGRMPGHMSVLLCEADIDYDKLYMMEDINDDFASCDIAVVIGANDVTNPAANTAEGTPIYGMPVLDVEKAPMAVFCNFDTKPGYAGVPNPLYEAENVLLMLGDAKESVQQLNAFVK